jgi:hypothetical protein
MVDLLPSLSTKYRIFLVTQVPSDNSPEHLLAKKQIAEELVQINAVQEHRAMFCCTSKGKESLVRQLSADLHIDSDAKLCSALSKFMSKFHLLTTDESKQVEADQCCKETQGKVINFKSVESYCQKIS